MIITLSAGIANTQLDGMSVVVSPIIPASLAATFSIGNIFII